jgi:hypothetical protein
MHLIVSAAEQKIITQRAAKDAKVKHAEVKKNLSVK